MKATWFKHILNFKQASGTSRGILHTKPSYFIVLEKDGQKGIGECGLLPGLSIDNLDEYEDTLDKICKNPEHYLNNYSLLLLFPSIRMGLETAELDLKNKNHILFRSEFSNGEKGIDINGLVWMGSKEFMYNQLVDKLEQGFHCIKLKIGAINFKDELSLLSHIRKHFSAKEIEIRVDANGAFAPHEALEKLNRLSDFHIHSIEQPIKQGQWQEMAQLVSQSPIDIALDEELIGVVHAKEQQELLKTIQPPYVIFKPSLLGGLKATEQWITWCNDTDIKWWATSALEGSVGLNAIAQWTAVQNNPMPQGLGTGALYTNNFDSPLEVDKGQLLYNIEKPWKIPNF